MRQYKKYYLQILRVELEDLDEMMNHLLIRFKEKMDAYGIAKAVYICIERKMKKVAKYVMQGQLCYI